jgi:hypothetical protein
MNDESLSGENLITIFKAGRRALKVGNFSPA